MTFDPNPHWSISLDRDHMIKRNGTSPSLVQKVRGVGLFDTKSQTAQPYYCENIRSILDIMDYTKAKNLPGILLFIDFEKAFDSLEWDFVNKCLQLFNFGPDFIKWVNIFYKNIQSCVINNGLCSHYFTIERGVRQGDPLSPHVFVTAVEILAIAVRNQANIKGLRN